MEIELAQGKARWLEFLLRRIPDPAFVKAFQLERAMEDRNPSKSARIVELLGG